VTYVIRSWNVFHGRTFPASRHAHLEEAVRLASADRPDVLCLQELPVWSLRFLEEWTGVAAVGEKTVQPIPLPSTLARRLTDLHHGALRSLLTGQANAVLVGSRLRVLAHRRLVLNDRSFRKEHVPRLKLSLGARIAWWKERRVCQAVRVALPDGRTGLILHVHATSAHGRLAELELERAVRMGEEVAAPGDGIVFAGDFNVRAAETIGLRELLRTAGFSEPGPGIDHIVVRGFDASGLEIWPEERRRVGGRVVSDHAPIELSVS
jgi:endonuclease/exonuclease/phosphatase family metal-dependent hydrolase